jgi:hypothetical protein
MLGNSLGLGVPVVLNATAILPCIAMNVEDDQDLVCMFLTTDKRMTSMCLGCIGVKGKMFCTKSKIVPGKLGMCGVNSHTKKVAIKPHHAFFQDNI